jgi:hypothetical protein
MLRKIIKKLKEDLIKQGKKKYFITIAPYATWAIDDVVDYANTTIDEMEIYEVKGDHHIKEIVNILRKAARELNDAVKILKDYPKIASEHAVQAKSYENQMEKTYHFALADLFKGKDTVYMLKMREIYRHLSNAADRGDEAANIIIEHRDETHLIRMWNVDCGLRIAE